MKNTTRYFIVILCLIVMHNSSMAQDFNASGLGMGGAYTAMARGVDAFFWNPANLAFKSDYRMEINLAGFNLNAANSSFTIDEYKRYFTESGHQGHWDEQEIDEILELIPEDGLDVNGEVNANVIGLLFGRYGFSVQGVGKALGIIPKSVLDFALRGNQELFKEFSFADYNGDGYSAIKLSLSLSHPIPLKKYFDEFGLGLNLNYYRGMGVVEVIQAEGAVVTTNQALESSVDLISRTSLGGTGFGFDLGAAGKVNDKWTVSMVLKNLFTGIKWTQELEEHRTIFTDDSITAEEFFDVKIDSLVTTTTQPTEEFRTSLPVVFHFGVAYEMYDNLTFALDLEQAFEKKLGYSDKAKLSMGVEYSPSPIVPLRAGLSIGGKWRYLFGLGVGLHISFFHLDLAYAMHQGMWPTKTTGYSAAANIKFVF
jgi:long-subunit fatty acid transport protein